MVNVKFYNEEVEMPKNIIKTMFDKQRELALKYKDVEDMGDLNEKGYLKSVQTKVNQKILKDFAWRVTEEITEFFHSYNEKDDPEHPAEELADALHFLLELYLLSGLDYDDLERYNDSTVRDEIPMSWASLEYNAMAFINKLGDAMNLLKNKPWKVSEVPCDEVEYRIRLLATFPLFLNICHTYQMELKTLYIYYFKKHKVNKFRVESKY